MTSNVATWVPCGGIGMVNPVVHAECRDEYVKLSDYQLLEQKYEKERASRVERGRINAAQDLEIGRLKKALDQRASQLEGLQHMMHRDDHPRIKELERKLEQSEACRRLAVSDAERAEKQLSALRGDLGSVCRQNFVYP